MWPFKKKPAPDPVPAVPFTAFIPGPAPQLEIAQIPAPAPAPKPVPAPVSPPLSVQKPVITPAPAPDPAPIAHHRTHAPNIEDILDGQALSYSYNNVKLCILRDAVPASSSFRLYDILRFVREPENAYDPNAVAVYDESARLGYVYKGKIQDMINSYLKDELPIFVFIDGVGSDGSVTFCVTFYRNKKIEHGRTFRLTRKFMDEYDRSDVGSSAPGDAVLIQYDSDAERFAVYSGDATLLGHFPPSADNCLDDSVLSDYRAQITDISFSDSGNYVVSVIVETK